MISAKPSLPMTLFAAASLTPALLLVLAMAWGGAFPSWLPLLYITLFAALMDRALFAGDAAEGAEFPAADWVLAVCAAAHIVLLPLLVAHLSGPAPMLDKIGLFMGASLWLGQIGNPAAHELIHRGSRPLFGLGSLMFSMIMFGHHTSAHRLVHHVHTATPNDPNTARSGEGFYAFFLRAWAGSFRMGLRAENALRARKTVKNSLHPYAVYTAIAGICLGTAFALGGALGTLIWAMLSLSATVQLMLSDYVQHYGLMRAMRENGKYAPVADRHSWNAPFWFSSAMMLNAPRHSDHHAHPARPFPELRLTDAPMLPWPLPLACTIALVPPMWKRAIRPHLKPWLI